MKRLKRFTYSLLAVILITSCSQLNEQGPDGLDGEVYFGVDYHFSPPFSYWDNNPSFPVNPELGEFYWSEPGTYDFEYFVNDYDYWYGTYTLSVNPGTEGGPYNEPGADGLDSFLMLYCDPNGWHADYFDYKGFNFFKKGETLHVEGDSGHFQFQLTFTKTDILLRPSNRGAKWGNGLDSN